VEIHGPPSASAKILSTRHTWTSWISQVTVTTVPDSWLAPDRSTAPAAPLGSNAPTNEANAS
jgi:hypothetical protein